MLFSTRSTGGLKWELDIPTLDYPRGFVKSVFVCSKVGVPGWSCSAIHLGGSGFNSQHLHPLLWSGWASVKPGELIIRELCQGFCGFNSRPLRSTGA